MCGFLGSLSLNPINSDKLLYSNKFQICRGPDELKALEGKISDYNNFNSDKFYNLVFNRLSIQDLTKFGSQPMYTKEFNSLILFNGEVFNHNELRKELLENGVEIASKTSDTEVVLKQLSLFGKTAIKKFNGQFSIVFFDFRRKNLLAIRDRMGQKPLFYFLNESELSFSTNLKSLVSLVGNYQINEDSLIHYIELGTVPAPNTIFKGFYKVNPGELFELNLDGQELKINFEKYWNVADFVDENKFNRDTFEEKLFNAIKLRHTADVPVASLLSGGLDSTTIIKIMSDNGLEINSFSIGFKGDKYDETKWSDTVALKYSLNHHKSLISIKNLEKEIFESIAIFDEPYFDPSNLPSNLIYKEISKKFKVAISGDGGDELLNGYLRTNLAIKRHSKNYSFDFLSNLYPGVLGTGARLSSYSNDLKSSYFSFLRDQKFKNLLIKSNNDLNYLNKIYTNTSNELKNLILIDYKFFLPELMMLKVDRTSMANSLEVRSPFVDHNLIEYMISVNYDDPNVINKNYLKQFLKKDFDEEFLNRKKMGFVFNLESWIFSNSNLLLEIINLKSNPLNIDKIILNLLFKIKTRINAHRIWKIVTLIKYLENIDEILLKKR